MSSDQPPSHMPEASLPPSPPASASSESSPADPSHLPKAPVSLSLSPSASSEPPPADPSQHAEVSLFLSDLAEKPSFWKNPFFIAALVGVLGLPLLRPFLPRRIPPPPPVLALIPSFSLTDHDGKPFGLDQMKGEVYIVHFFFTSCPTICPRIIEAMRDLQRRYSRAKLPIRLLSISVDPDTDTPQKLRTYASSLQLDLARWTLLTGPKERIYRLAEEGFKTAVGSATSRPSVMEITHSEKLILVDQIGRIRGYYPIGPLGIDEIFHRSQHVLHSFLPHKS